MATWDESELQRIAAPDELRIAGLRVAGTLRSDVVIWSVLVDGALYVRSVNGPTAAWYRGTRARHLGRVSAGGVTADVQFVDIDPADAVQALIDAEYARKYRRYAQSIVDHINGEDARAATLRADPLTAS